MTMPSDVVQVDKTTLRFNLSPSLSSPQTPPSPTWKSSPINDTLCVTNISPNTLAFKVKTTNQTRYIVSPNLGTISADSAQRIFIAVQPEAEVPVPGASRDKFLLKLTPLDAVASAELSSPSAVATFWRKREDDESVVGIKFRVEFIDGAPQSSSGASSPATSSSPLAPRKSRSDVTSTPPHRAPPAAPPSLDLQQQAQTSTSSASAAAAAPLSASSPPADLVSSPAVAPPAAPPADRVSLSDADTLLRHDKYDDAMARVAKLQALLDEKNLALARLRAELTETRAETDRVLKEAPSAPMAANRLLSDPFGGVSVAGLALMLLLFLIVVNVVLRVIQ